MKKYKIFLENEGYMKRTASNWLYVFYVSLFIEWVYEESNKT